MKELLYLEERPFCASKIRKIELGCEILFRATSIPTRYLVAWIDSSRSGTATRVQRGTTRVEKRNKRERERETERRTGNRGGRHVSRLSVFTEIPCTLYPITFVTDYSSKVSPSKMKGG